MDQLLESKIISIAIIKAFQTSAWEFCINFEHIRSAWYGIKCFIVSKKGYVSGKITTYVGASIVIKINLADIIRSVM